MPHRIQPRAARDLGELRGLVLRMAELSEAILDKSLSATWNFDPEIAREVASDDLEIDRLDLEIDHAVLQILALSAPVAADLRQVLAIKAIATDLERVGDLARNIAGSARRLAERPPVPLPPELHALADDSRNLMRLAIHAFCELDARAARDVLEKDDLIDELEDLLVRESIRRLSTTPEHTEQELDVIFIAQHLERIGDHATNIAEEVILAAEALNLKHFSKLSH